MVEKRTGVRQGCLLSPFVFLLVIKGIMLETAEKHRDGIRWTLTTQLEDVGIADDIAVLSHNHQGVQCKVKWLAKISTVLGSPNPRQRRW